MPRVSVSLLLGLLLSACNPGATPLPDAQGPAGPVTEARVVYVVDGDTIRVEINGDEVAVRYVGINAAERDEPCGDAATGENRQLVSGRKVWLERDRSDTDRFGRLLRYVWLRPRDGEWVFVNGELVRLGAAEARSYPPDTRRQAALQAAEDDARRAERGCAWSPMGTGSVPRGLTISARR